jgi:hypothetical protein
MNRKTRPQIRQRGTLAGSGGGATITAACPQGNDAGEVIETEL